MFNSIDGDDLVCFGKIKHFLTKCYNSVECVFKDKKVYVSSYGLFLFLYIICQNCGLRKCVEISDNVNVDVD